MGINVWVIRFEMCRCADFKCADDKKIKNMLLRALRGNLFMHIGEDSPCLCFARPPSSPAAERG
jgi:hypothetical protein